MSWLYTCDKLLIAPQAVFYVIQIIHDNLNSAQGMELQEKKQKEAKFCRKAA